MTARSAFGICSVRGPAHRRSRHTAKKPKKAFSTSNSTHHYPSWPAQAQTVSSSSTPRRHSLPMKRLNMTTPRTYDVTHYRSLHTYATRTGFMLRNTNCFFFLHVPSFTFILCVFPSLIVCCCLRMQISIIVIISLKFVLESCLRMGILRTVVCLERDFKDK
jgi:hypothetical protein